MNWNSIKEDEKLCEIFKKNPLINPLTGRQIEYGGPTFKEWEKKCGKIKKTGIVTYEKCNAFNKNPNINPETGREISKNGNIYKYWNKHCKNITKNNELIGEYYHPNNKGLVPVKIHDSKKYIIRLDTKTGNRRVWGPLNLGIISSSEIKFVHFMETWDYINNKYVPIFQPGSSLYYKNEYKSFINSDKFKNTNSDKSKNKSNNLIEKFFNNYLFE